MKNKNILLIFAIGIVLNMSLVLGAADFAVNSFSCTPSEVSINNVFSCTAQVINNGDASGSVSVATLYPDANDWLESSNYPKTDGTSVSPGQTTEITFSGLRTTKSGVNGFARILLDDVTDTYVSDNNVEVNIVDVAVSIGNSASSVAMSGTFDSTAEVNAGGNIDVTLTFVVDSGGCSIGSQGASKTISNMQDGNTQSRTWSVTQGTTGNCKYTITASATGDAGVATKTDSTSSTVTCTDCPTSSSSSSSSSGGSGGGGAGGVVSSSLGELTSERTVSLGINQAVSFNISGVKHKMNVKNLTETKAEIAIESEVQYFNLTLQDRINVDLTEDKKADLTVFLKSINVITKKATFVLSASATGATTTGDAGGETNKDGGAGGTGKTATETFNEIGSQIKEFGIGKFVTIVLVLIVIIVVIFMIIRARKGYEWFNLRHSVKVKPGKHVHVG